MIATTTAGQECASTQHDGNQLAGSSTEFGEGNDTEEVMVDITGENQQKMAASHGGGDGTRDQEFAATKHDGNPLTGSSNALADLSSMEEVIATADGDQQSSGEVTRTTNASKLRKRAKRNKRRKDLAYHAPPPPGP